MAMTDPFTPNAFNVVALTHQINSLPYQPRRLAALFEEKRTTSTIVVAEEKNGLISIISPTARGGPGSSIPDSTRTAIPLEVPHIQINDGLTADEVQNIRAFGSDSVTETLTARLNEKLLSAKNSVEYTLESHRVAAIKGSYVNKAGASISLFTTFGVSQQTQALGLHSTNRSQIKQKVFAAKQKVLSALKDQPMSGALVLCGDDFWSALIDDKDTRDTYLNHVAASELRGDPMERFVAFGATWEWYQGTSSVNLGSDAYLIPLGVSGLCTTTYAPADYIETVNTEGLPYYSRAWSRENGKGYSMEAQTNALTIVTRPAAIIKLTIS